MTRARRAPRLPPLCAPLPPVSVCANTTDAANALCVPQGGQQRHHLSAAMIERSIFARFVEQRGHDNVCKVYKPSLTPVILYTYLPHSFLPCPLGCPACEAGRYDLAFDVYRTGSACIAKRLTKCGVRFDSAAVTATVTASQRGLYRHLGAL